MRGAWAAFIFVFISPVKADGILHSLEALQRNQKCLAARLEAQRKVIMDPVEIFRSQEFSQLTAKNKELGELSPDIKVNIPSSYGGAPVRARYSLSFDSGQKTVSSFVVLRLKLNGEDLKHARGIQSGLYVNVTGEWSGHLPESSSGIVFSLEHRSSGDALSFPTHDWGVAILEVIVTRRPDWPSKHCGVKPRAR